MKNPIKKIRKRENLSRNDLALLIGVSYSTLAEAENMTIKSPEKIVKKICEVFSDLDEEEFMDAYSEYRDQRKQDLLKKISN